MTSQTVLKQRPLSPHLQIYRPQISSGMSIFHRITGIGLTLGLPVLVFLLFVLAAGQDMYEHFIQFCHNPIVQVLLFGWTWAFFYHFCCGIRHLIWDAGYFISKTGLNIGGLIALAVSTVLTIGTWLHVYGYLL